MYPTKKLSEICEIINWWTPDTSVPSYWNGDIFWITPKDMWQLEGIYVSETSRTISESWMKNSSAKLFPINSVILSSRAPIWHLAVNTVPMATNQGCKGLIPKNEIYYKYLYYFLLESKELLNSLWSGTTFKELSSTKLKEVEIPLPPLSIQSRIVAKLDEAFGNIDSQIDLLRSNIRDVENMKFSIIEKIFKDGGYQIKTLKNVCDRIMDGTHFSPKNSDSGDKLYVSAKNIKHHGVDFTKATYISQEDHDAIYKRCPVKKGDVLYIKDWATTWIATINQLDEEFSLLSSVAVFQVKENILSAKFLTYYLNSDFWKKHMLSMMWWAAITRLTLTKLNSWVIPLPPLTRQHEIVLHLDAVFDQSRVLRSEYEAQIRDLEIMKQSLLEEAFAGRLVME